ncbi:MAG: hypothetical protein L0Y79_12705 [Chlorobi bacterium]|nr:hypothetical protein [Chlorobiota bacterium]MCI0715420.1 hypothetical protein [Chlorobiota bacterium]
MSELNSKLQTVKSKENFLEKIVRFIPGYDGYVNRDNSRELDTLLRNTLATKLDSNHTRLKNTILNLSKSGKLFESGGIDKLDKKLQQCVAKFKAAAKGYSGAFDVVKVKEDKLNQLYEFDANLLDNVESISAACTEMENSSKSGGDLSTASDKVSALLDELVKLFDERENILNAV